MSTKVSDIFDALDTIVTTNLSAYSNSKIHPYLLEKNAQVTMQKGYGIAFGPAVNTNRMIGVRSSIQRQYYVILTNLVTHNDYDQDGRIANEKALLEDCIVLIKAIESNVTLATTAGVAGPAVNAQWVADDGIEYIQNQNSSFLFCQMTFEIEYMEVLA